MVASVKTKCLQVYKPLGPTQNYKPSKSIIKVTECKCLDLQTVGWQSKVDNVTVKKLNKKLSCCCDSRSCCLRRTRFLRLGFFRCVLLLNDSLHLRAKVSEGTNRNLPARNTL